jgi:hypothetical protein
MPFLAISQTQTPRYISTGPNSNGYYEYLPAGYSTGKTSYPLLVFLQGEGTLGNGVSGLPLLLKEGVPMVIKDGQFPDSFNVKGKDYSFIVIQPQYKAWPTDNDVNDIITYALAHYRVDTGRIYLTGLSMGGSAIWAYISNSQPAHQLAATLPIAGGQMYAGMAGATIIANANLAVYSTANLNDPAVPSVYTVNDIKMIDSVVPPVKPKAIDTIYNAYGHDAWTETYNPSTKLYQGLNAYQWMLLYTRDSTDKPQPATYPPPAPDTIVWASFTATWPGGQSVATLRWTPSLETNEPYFLVERSANGKTFTTLDTLPATAYLGNVFTDSAIDAKPLADSDYYRIAAVFMDGKDSYSPIREVVSLPVDTLPPPPPDTIAWSSFTGTWPAGQSEVVLSWATTRESNDHYFLVQRSANGQTFNTFDTVAAASNGANGYTYNALDSSPFPDSDYYRLEAVFLDGKVSYSVTIKVVSMAPVQPTDTAKPSSPDTVALTSFTAQALAGPPAVELNWATSFELNDQYFYVQRSSNAETFYNIDTVAAAADSGIGFSYSAVDNNPLAGADYYRLAMIYRDGTIGYSAIQEVVFQQGRDSFFISPNPAVGSLNLLLRNNITGNLNVRVLDMQGRTLRTWAFVKQDELWTQSIDIGQLSMGSYIIQVIGDAIWIARPFIIK